MPSYGIEGARRRIVLNQVATRFDTDESRPEFLALHDIVQACFRSLPAVPAPNTLTVARRIRREFIETIQIAAINHWNRTDRSDPAALVPVDFSNIGGPAMHVDSGIITMWSGLLTNIPAGWALCDGAGGRPDLRDKFVRGAPPATDPGTTGGANSHTHASHPLLAHAGSAVTDHAAQSHAGSAVADHAAQSHSGTAVADHASHTHNVTTAPATPDLFKSETGGGGVAGLTDGPSVTLTHAVTQPNAHPILAHAVTQPDAHPILAHAVTQPNNHAAQTHDTASNVPEFFTLAFIIKV